MFAQDSINLLVTLGISFEGHAAQGINPLHFGKLLIVSGLMLTDQVKWVSFHSGYNFAYLLQVLTSQCLTQDDKVFFEFPQLYFPTIYDIKYTTSLCDGHSGRLIMSSYFALATSKFTKDGTTDDTRDPRTATPTVQCCP